MKLRNILVLGGGGFIGRHLIAQLARQVLRITVPSRQRERAKHLILLPTVDVVEENIFAPGVLERLARGQDAVVNLVGVLHGNFARMHVELPRQPGEERCQRRRKADVRHYSIAATSTDEIGGR